MADDQQPLRVTRSTPRSFRPTRCPPSRPVDLTPVPLDTGYTAAGVPTFESVREKIENRFGTAIGVGELAEDTPKAGRWPSSTRRGSKRRPSG